MAVLEVLRGEPGALWGLEICRKLNLKPGTVYPILRRLEAAGWVESSWEVTSGVHKGPRRRFYALTANGSSGVDAIFASSVNVNISSQLSNLGLASL